MSVKTASLSQEIINILASLLQQWEHEDRASIWGRGRALLPAYTTISQPWQYAIEYHTFHEIAVRNTEINDLSRIVIKHRRKLLRRLELNVVLPTYADNAKSLVDEDDSQSSHLWARSEL